MSAQEKPMRKTNDQSEQKPDRYAEFRTNLYLPSQLSDVAKRWFRKTRYGSLSGFVKSKIRHEIKTNAAKIRKAGIPVSVSITSE